MLVNSATSNHNINFGINYSYPMVTAMNEITDRFFKVRQKYRNKFNYYGYSYNFIKILSKMSHENRLNIIPPEFENYLLKENNMNKIFSTINFSFPTRTLYLQQHPQKKQFYVTMDCFLGKKFLAPVRTKNNLNPIQHPEAIHMRFKDLQTISTKIQNMTFEKFLSNILNKLNKKVK